MNSKLVRILLIINGILIPAFLIYIFGIIYLERELNKKQNEGSELNLKRYEEAKNKPSETFISHSGPFSIPTTPFSYLTVEMETEEDQFYVEEIPIDFKTRANGVRGKTVNILFLDANQNQLRPLLAENGLIVYMSVANKNEALSGIGKINHIAYVLAASDTNGDKKITNSDQLDAYISDVDGQNLKQITDGNFKNFAWLHKSNQLLLTLTTQDSLQNLKYAVYDLNTGETKPVTRD